MAFANPSNKFNLPDPAGSVQWIAVGTFVAQQGGDTCIVRMTLNVGYTANPAQQEQVVVQFTTSNSLNVDSYGFAGAGSYYQIGQGGALQKLKWLSDQSGVKATQYTLYIQAGPYLGTSFYEVVTGKGTWNTLGQANMADPGVASATVQLAIEAFYTPSPVTLTKSPFISRFVVPDTSSSVHWIVVGSFAASQGGDTCCIRMLLNAGYNGKAAQQEEVFLQFATSNGISVDAKGFAGASRYYQIGQGGPLSAVKWLSDQAGTKAGKYTLYVQAQPFPGVMVYQVLTGLGSWANIGQTNGVDPGVASSTVQIASEALYTPSPFQFPGTSALLTV